MDIMEGYIKRAEEVFADIESYIRDEGGTIPYGIDTIKSAIGEYNRAQEAKETQRVKETSGAYVPTIKHNITKTWQYGFFANNHFSPDFFGTIKFVDATMYTWEIRDSLVNSWSETFEGAEADMFQAAEDLKCIIMSQRGC